MDLFFDPKGKTLDVGAGSGRELRYLYARGFKSLEGCDASTSMLEEAKRRSPKFHFFEDSLPGLAKIEDKTYSNICCSGVLMHLPAHEIVESLINLLRILTPSGVLLLSFRPPRAGHSDDFRELDGRLFTPLHVEQLTLILEGLGAKVLFKSAKIPSEDDGKTWTTIVVRKETATNSGLRVAQTIVVNEQKSATYKLALLMSLTLTAQSQAQSVLWQGARVLVPLKLIAEHWIKLYWKMVEAGVRNASATQMSFQPHLLKLIAHRPGGPFDLLMNLDKIEVDEQSDLLAAMSKIVSTIKLQPARFAGPEEYSIFTPTSAPDSCPREFRKFGYLGMPGELWRDLTLFAPWVQSRILFEWLGLLKNYNKNRDQSDLWMTLTYFLTDPERAQSELRAILNTDKAACVWTGKVTKYDVDHLLPWALLKNNDLWNLMPADPVVNGEKSDLVPSLAALEASRDKIVGYWRKSEAAQSERFWREARLALAANIDPTHKELSFNLAFRGLIELAERTATAYGSDRWSPKHILASSTEFLRVADRTAAYRPKRKR